MMETFAATRLAGSVATVVAAIAIGIVVAAVWLRLWQTMNVTGVLVFGGLVSTLRSGALALVPSIYTYMRVLDCVHIMLLSCHLIEAVGCEATCHACMCVPA